MQRGKNSIGPLFLRPNKSFERIDAGRKRNQWWFPFVGFLGTLAGIIYAFAKQEHGNTIDVMLGIIFTLIVTTLLTSASAIYLYVLYVRDAH